MRSYGALVALFFFGALLFLCIASFPLMHSLDKAMTHCPFVFVDTTGCGGSTSDAGVFFHHLAFVTSLMLLPVEKIFPSSSLHNQDVIVWLAISLITYLFGLFHGIIVYLLTKSRCVFFEAYHGFYSWFCCTHLRAPTKVP